jgi:hypothetical protein
MCASMSGAMTADEPQLYDQGYHHIVNVDVSECADWLISSTLRP